MYVSRRESTGVLNIPSFSSAIIIGTFNPVGWRYIQQGKEKEVYPCYLQWLLVRHVGGGGLIKGHPCYGKGL